MYTESTYTVITRTLCGPCVMIVRFWKAEIWLVMDEESKEREWVRRRPLHAEWLDTMLQSYRRPSWPEHTGQEVSEEFHFWEDIYNIPSVPIKSYQ